MPFFVLSQYSGVTASKSLWRVHTRKMDTKKEAEDFMDFLKSDDKLKNKKKTYFIVEKDGYDYESK